ncbi:hypothetical protein CJD92_22395 [Salmonella enterica subsp. enterica serovar Newport]|nr:hypothetical protein [Salmonella enterica subsp. enterica serovar Newport]
MNLVKLYERLISYAESENGKPCNRGDKKPFYEIHHIKPRSIAGGDESSNLVYLTLKQHYFVHYLLACIYGGKCAVAFMAMTNSGIYHTTERNRYRAVTMYRKANVSEKVTCEHCNKTVSKGAYTRSHGDKCRVYTGKKTASQIAKEKRLEKYEPYKVSDKMTVTSGYNIRYEYRCPYCFMAGHLPGIAIHHFDNCHKKKEYDSFKVSMLKVLDVTKDSRLQNGTHIYRLHEKDYCNECGEWPIDSDYYKGIAYLIEIARKAIDAGFIDVNNHNNGVLVREFEQLTGGEIDKLKNDIKMYSNLNDNISYEAYLTLKGLKE